MMKLNGWDHVTYTAPDLDAAEAWYRRVLRAEVALRVAGDSSTIPPRNPQVWLHFGAATLNIAEGEPIERGANVHFYHYALSANLDDLDRWMEHLRQQDVTPYGPFAHDKNRLISIYLDDLNGYRLELTFDCGSPEQAVEEAISRNGEFGNPAKSYARRGVERP